MNAKSSTNASKSAKARKTGSPMKRAAKKAASGEKVHANEAAKAAASASLQERIKEAKKLEAIDRQAMLLAKPLRSRKRRLRTLIAQQQFSRNLRIKERDLSQAGRSGSCADIKMDGTAGS